MDIGAEFGVACQADVFFGVVLDDLAVYFLQVVADAVGQVGAAAGAVRQTVAAEGEDGRGGDGCFDFKIAKLKLFDLAAQLLFGLGCACSFATGEWTLEVDAVVDDPRILDVSSGGGESGGDGELGHFGSFKMVDKTSVGLFVLRHPMNELYGSPDRETTGFSKELKIKTLRGF